MDRRLAVKGQGLQVRQLRSEDMDEVARLEAELFSTPWSARTFRSALAGPHAVLLGVQEGASLIAYAVMWCIEDQGELANIAVAPDRQGEGIGSLLLDEVLRVARARGVRQMYLDVRESNARAISMYRGRGFEPVGLRRAYYERPREDALVLMKRL
jgi:ribosomal-protein-alanine N-acetyltransferase